MISTKQIISAIIISLFLIVGCSSESDSEQQTDEVVLGKLELSEGWARPGSKEQNSAAYVTIQNGTASNDTLLDISSDAANKTEVHESYEEESGVSGMRPAGSQPIAEGNKLSMEPGGLHIMLIDLKRQLAVGDSLDLSFEFSRAGGRTITVPVQVQN